jgi:hypothetical protein
MKKATFWISSDDKLLSSTGLLFGNSYLIMETTCDVLAECLYEIQYCVLLQVYSHQLFLKSDDTVLSYTSYYCASLF